MNIKEILNLDKGLRLVYPKVWNDQIEGITTVTIPKDNYIFFLKEYKFYKYWVDTVNNSDKKEWLEIGVVVDKALFEDEKNKTFILNNVGFVILSENIDLSICLISEPFYQKKYGEKNDTEDGRETGTAKIHPTASIANGVFIGEGVSVGENVKIYSGSVIMSGVKIDKNTVIYPNVTVYYSVEIGRDCRIHSGCVIGADGFGYKAVNGVHRKIWHVGSVIIEDGVEIGALSSVDSGTFIPTRIGKGTIIDNQVQIGHNSQIGKGVILCGQSGTSGSAVLGDYTVCGGKAGIGNDVTVGENCQIAGNAMVNTSWPANSVLGGHPARPLREWLRGLAYIRKQVKNKL